MKQLIFFSIVLLAMTSCNLKPQASSNEKAEIVADSCDSQLISPADKMEIEKLFRNLIEWDNNDTIRIDLLPAIADEQDSIYIGFDFQKLEITIQQLRNTGFFSETFIDNYKRIITELDRKLRNKKLENWPVGELPTFKFANDYDPFSNSQDIAPIDSIGFISGNQKNVEAKWFTKWPNINGDIETYENCDCNFEKENGSWKISYLSGFDYENGIKKDGVVE